MVERKQTHVVELGLTFSHHASLPLKFWNFVFLTFVYLINKFPKASLNFSIPYHVLFMLSHDYNFLKTFGYSCLFFFWDGECSSDRLNILTQIMNPEPLCTTKYSSYMQTRSKSGIHLLSINPSLLLTRCEPKNVKHALTYPNWLSSMQLDCEALMKNHTWKLVPLSSNWKASGYLG